MKKNKLAIVVLSISAAFLLGLNLFLPTPARALLTIRDRDYQIVTARSQGGSDALYIMDNRRGTMIVFSWDASAKTIVARDAVVMSTAVTPKN